jgi:hypothetical protein
MVAGTQAVQGVVVRAVVVDASRQARQIRASWVAGEWLAHQRLELEVDLIAAHLLVTGQMPAAQFLG